MKPDAEAKTKTTTEVEARFIAELRAKGHEPQLEEDGSLCLADSDPEEAPFCLMAFCQKCYSAWCPFCWEAGRWDVEECTGDCS